MAGAAQPGNRRAVTVGISLKMFFTHSRTVDWCEEVAALARSHAAVTEGFVTLIVLPSFLSVPAAVGIFAGTGVGVGAQDLCWHDDGPFTGEVSGSQLKGVGCTHVEVGHAERRRLFGDDLETVAAKTAAALRNGLIPILCVGEPEPLEPNAAAEYCVAELRSALAVARDAGVSGTGTVAYEPQWAIGAVDPAPVPHIATVCKALDAYLSSQSWLHTTTVIYGGAAQPGLLTRLGSSASGLFLGRAAHNPEGVSQVLDEVLALQGSRR
jgi:triosephosphate isomerase (TIM)